MERAVSHYFLPHHIHACFAANRTIFLDMKRGRYFGLDPEKTELLRHALDDVAETEPSTLVAAELIGMGLLTTSRQASKLFQPPAAIPPAVSLLPPIDDRPRI